jgi:hypothetical protein
VLLVPEAFVDDASQNVTEVAAGLISVDEIAKKISMVTDRTLLLIDACRAHKDEANQLIDAWQLGLDQHADLKGILGALQFASGIFGPYPMIFASADGVAAPTVALPAQKLATGTGPLAAVLSNTFTRIADDGGTLDLASFLSDVQRPQTLGQPAIQVEAHTFIRDDFVQAFGTVPLVSSEPQQIVPRKQLFKPPYEGLVSRLGTALPVRSSTASHVTSREVATLDSGDILDVAASSDGRNVWLLDDREQVFQVEKGGRLKRINNDLPAESISWDKTLGLMLMQWDEAKLYRYRTDGWHVVTKNLRPLRLISDDDDQTLAFSQTGSTRYTLVRSHRPSQRVCEFDSTELLDVASMNGSTCWILEAAAIRELSGLQLRSALPLWRPTLLSARHGTLYVISEDGRMLYRLRNLQAIEQIDLIGAGLGDSYIRRFGSRAFRVLADETALVGMGPVLVRVGLQSADWRPFVASGPARTSLPKALAAKRLQTMGGTNQPISSTLRTTSWRGRS